MKATFGVSTHLAIFEFNLMLNLDLLSSWYPQQYGDVGAPFILPPIQADGGEDTHSSYVGNLELSLVSQGMAYSPRDILGEHPRIIVSHDGGNISQRVVQWTDSNRLLWRVDATSSTPAVVKILSIQDSNGVERWRNPSD